eukprot:jgi/Mesen1/8131/ME000437S07222
MGQLAWWLLKLLAYVDPHRQSGEYERSSRVTLVAISLLTLIFGTLLAAVFGVCGLYSPSLICASYVILLLLLLVHYNGKRDLVVFRAGQLLLLQLVPASVQVSLGGFSPSGGCILWGLLSAPLSSIVPKKELREDTSSWFQPWPGFTWILSYVCLNALVYGGEMYGLWQPTAAISAEEQTLLLFLNITGFALTTWFMSSTFITVWKSETSLEKRRFRTLLELTSEGIAICKSDGCTVLDANKAFLDMLGIGMPELLTWKQGAKRLHEFFTPESQGRFLCPHYLPPPPPPPQQQQQQQQPALDSQMSFDVFMENDSRAPLLNGDGGAASDPAEDEGAVPCFVETCVTLQAVRASGEVFDVEMVRRDLDIEGEQMVVLTFRETRVRDALEKAERAAELAMQAQETKQQFLANMSHEIRTPLNGVVGCSELLLGMKLSREQYEYATMIRTCSRSLVAVVDDILDRINLQNGSITITSAPLDLLAIVEDAVCVIASVAVSKGVGIGCVYANDVPKDLRGDSGRVRQVITSLVSNAVKFTKRGNVLVEVELGADGPVTSEVLITVTDSGIGIPPAELDNIFDAFVQLDSSNSRAAGGTGLGLSISRQMARLMGGDVTLTHTEEGLGSAFTFRVPLDKAVSPDQHSPRLHHLPLAAAGGTGAETDVRVLVVDKDDVTRRVFAGYMTQLGVWYECVPSCKEAVHRWHLLEGTHNAINLIYLDTETQAEASEWDLREVVANSREARGQALPHILAMTYPKGTMAKSALLGQPQVQIRKLQRSRSANLERERPLSSPSHPPFPSMFFPPLTPSPLPGTRDACGDAGSTNTNANNSSTGTCISSRDHPSAKLPPIHDLLSSPSPKLPPLRTMPEEEREREREREREERRSSSGASPLGGAGPGAPRSPVPRPPPPAPARARSPPTPKIRVLLAEDNRMNQKVATKILRDCGYEVLVANNGMEAVDIICNQDQNLVDLVLMDIQMPVLDGFAATSKIRQFEAECPSPGYVTKPIDRSALVDTISGFFGRAS